MTLEGNEDDIGAGTVLSPRRLVGVAQWIKQSSVYHTNGEFSVTFSNYVSHQKVAVINAIL